jgi:prophage maintenance system killer protein
MGVEELPTVKDIHAIHEFIEEQWDLSHRGTRAVLPDQTLESILDDVRTLDGEYRRAAALLNRLADAHVYEAGNKRTAWTVAETYLNEAGHEAVPADAEAARVLLNRRRFDEAELATWLETGEIPEERFRDS